MYISQLWLLMQIFVLHISSLISLGLCVMYKCVQSGLFSSSSLYLLHAICGQCKISMTSKSLKFPMCFF